MAKTHHAPLRLWKASVYLFNVNCGSAMFHRIDAGAFTYRLLVRSDFAQSLSEEAWCTYLSVLYLLWRAVITPSNCVSRQALSTVTISGVPMKPHDFHSHLYEDHSSLWQFFWDSWHSDGLYTGTRNEQFTSHIFTPPQARSGDKLSFKSSAIPRSWEINLF
ncbi:hypothetical protein P692DRAFT_20840134 [Suillus brevipes Sb2]|nr:hypothetical protein P692DRAFT_20840134 [Suillus brevipes Sb2]